MTSTATPSSEPTTASTSPPPATPEQLVPKPTPDDQSAKTLRRQVVVRPSCTHAVMDRVFNTDYRCQICQRIPSIGFIYVCQQDNDLVSKMPTQSKAPRGQSKPKKRTLAEELQHLGFSTSVIKAAEEGLYTPKQLDILKRQKRHVKEVIEDVLYDDERLKSKTGPAPDILTQKLLQLKASTNGRSHEENLKPVIEEKNSCKQKGPAWSNPVQPCDFRVCHTCRPFSRDRSYSSFEAVLENGSSQVWTPEFMPVGNAELLSKMDWHPDTLDVEEPEGNGKARPSLRHRPTTGSRGFRHSLEESFRQLTREADTSDNIPVDEAEEEPDHHFDLARWKKMMSKVQDIATATRLPGRESEDSLTNTYTAQEQKHTHNFNEEEHVDGGIALTEEAVETRSPDIILAV